MSMDCDYSMELARERIEVEIRKQEEFRKEAAKNKVANYAADVNADIGAAPEPDHY